MFRRTRLGRATAGDLVNSAAEKGNRRLDLSVRRRKDGAEDSQRSRSGTAHTDHTVPGRCSGGGRAQDGPVFLMGTRSTAVRLYRLYWETGDVVSTGEPFALCDQHMALHTHEETQRLEKILDETVRPCEACDRERQKAADEGEV
jgi:hypothetical protein